MSKITIKGPNGDEDIVYGDYDEQTRTATTSGGKKIQASQNDRVEVSGCFVATEIYGDFNHHKVVTLRKYRDKVIIPSGLAGHVFVKMYYKIGPYAAHLLHVIPVLRPFVRRLLDSIIRKCERTLKD
ncbi:MAG: hypothetical protein GY801_25755 [bacterium]|nr:hypothetical protein [bacterium]